MSKAKSGKKDLIVDVKEMRWVEIETLKEFQGNLKDLVDDNYKKLKKDILALGFSEAITVWDDQGTLKIMNGHQRFRTLMRMKEEGHGIPQIPVVVIHAKDPREAALKVLSLTSQMGVMTGQGLYEFMNDHEITMEELTGSFRFPEINFDSFKMEFFDDNIIEPVGEEDEAPEPPKETFVKMGDFFILGNHKLLCGDATQFSDYEKLLGTEKMDMVCVDPPYNVAYTGKTKDSLTIKNDSMSDESFYQFLYDMYANLLAFTKPGSAIYVAHADSEGVNFRKALKDAGWLLKQCLIWVKQTLVMGRQDYHWKHEPILYGWMPGASHNWYTDRKQTTVLEFNKPNRNAEHPTMKPVELIEYLIKNSSEKGNLVIDVFGGSGTTLIACEKMGRHARLMELDPKYCEVILNRFEKYTGRQAFLQNEDGTQISFQELKAQAELVS